MARIADIFAGLDEIVQENAPLKELNWFKLGGPARYLIRPRDVEELRVAVARCVENGIAVYVLGLGANILIDDEGVDGAVFRLSAEEWRKTRFDGEVLEAGAGVDMQKLMLRAVRQGRAGLECLAGIPGTIGGGIHGNAGGRWGDIGTLVRGVTVMDTTGTVFQRTKEDLVFEYRRTNILARFILSATLGLEEDDPDRIMQRVKEYWMYKKNTQPLSTKNAGCVFKNPRGLAAGALIDQAGLKGLTVGGAQVSQKHANFIIAHPGCTSADVRKLIKIVQERVSEKHTVDLQLEIQLWPVRAAGE
jgi:UDP-N-acetylmuramate dehydrogenase